MTLGVHDYGWYLWHYLYNNYLQQVWALFAMLFAFGGLIREKSSGSVFFSLSLPVSRRQWLFSRLALAFVESVALALFAVAVVMVGSPAIHQSYSLAQILLHTALMVGVGVFSIAFGNLCYSLFPGDYLSLLITLVLLGVPYLILQTYMQHLSYFGKTSWLAYLDFAHTMAGPWQLSWSTVPWIALITSWHSLPSAGGSPWLTETALTTEGTSRLGSGTSTWRALGWKAWRESQTRFAAAFVMLTALVIYGVITAPEYTARHNAHFPDKPLPYSVYVWSGFFTMPCRGFGCSLLSC